jgi:hypothetical protein
LATSDIIFGIALALMAGASIHFGGRVTAPRLPMQWGFNREPTWYAPRLIALWFSVGLAVLVRLFILVLETSAPEKLNQASLGLILFSVIIATAHVIHLRAAARWAARQ